MRKERRSRSRKRRKERNIELEESPEPKKKYCYSECKLEERNKRGKMIACGLLCHRHDEHDEEDCKCQKHIREEETVRQA